MAVYVLDTPMSVKEASQRYAYHTSTDAATLFLVDTKLLPEHGDTVAMTDWQFNLHMVGQARIYAYEDFNGTVAVFPVHFCYPLEGGNLATPRVVVHGKSVDWEKLTYAVSTGGISYAHFQDVKFWQFAADDAGTAQRTQREDPYRAAGQNKANYTQANTGSPNYQTKESPAETAARKRREEVREQTRRYQEAARKRDRDQQYEQDFGEEFWQDFWNEDAQPKQGQQQTARKSDWDVIGAPANCQYDVAKKAYRARMAVVHPDRHPEAEKAQWTVEAQAVNCAWDNLRRSQGWPR